MFHGEYGCSLFNLLPMAVSALRVRESSPKNQNIWCLNGGSGSIFWYLSQDYVGISEIQEMLTFCMENSSCSLVLVL